MKTRHSAVEVSALEWAYMGMSMSYEKTPGRNEMLSLLRAAFERNTKKKIFARLFFDPTELCIG